MKSPLYSFNSYKFHTSYCSSRNCNKPHTAMSAYLKEKFVKCTVYLLKLLLVLFPMALLHMPFLGFGTAERDKALETLQIFVLVWKDSGTLSRSHYAKVHLFKSAMSYLQGWTVGAGGPLIVIGLYGSADFSGGASDGVSGSPLPNTISSIFKISESILVQRYCVFS